MGGREGKDAQTGVSQAGGRFLRPCSGAVGKFLIPPPLWFICPPDPLCEVRAMTTHVCTAVELLTREIREEEDGKIEKRGGEMKRKCRGGREARGSERHAQSAAVRRRGVEM